MARRVVPLGLLVLELFQGLPARVGRGLVLDGQLAKRGFHVGIALAFGMHMARRQGQAQAFVDVMGEVDAMRLGVQRDQVIVVRRGLSVQLENLALIPADGHVEGRRAMVTSGVHRACHVDVRDEQRARLVQCDRYGDATTCEFLFVRCIEEVLVQHPIELVHPILQASEGNGVIGKGFHVRRGRKSGRQM